jgi:hypothetical protein
VSYYLSVGVEELNQEKLTPLLRLPVSWAKRLLLRSASILRKQSKIWFKLGMLWDAKLSTIREKIH